MKKYPLISVRISIISLFLVVMAGILSVSADAQTHGKVTASSANLRQGPDTTSTVIARIPRGESAKLAQAGAFGDWYYVEYKGKKGWLHKTTIDLVTIAPPSASRPTGPRLAGTTLAAPTVAAEREKYVWREARRLNEGTVMRVGVKKQPSGNKTIEWVAQMTKPASGSLYGASKAALFQWVHANCSTRTLYLDASADYDSNGKLARTELHGGTVAGANQLRDVFLENICGKPGARQTASADASDQPAKDLSVERSKYVWQREQKLSDRTQRYGTPKTQGEKYTVWVSETRASSGRTLMMWYGVNCTARGVWLNAEAIYDRDEKLSSYDERSAKELSSYEREAVLANTCRPANTGGVPVAKTLGEEQQKYDWRSPERITGVGTVRVGLRKSGRNERPDWVLEVDQIAGAFFIFFRQIQFLRLQADCSSRNIYASSMGVYSSGRDESSLVKDGPMKPGKLLDFVHRSICVGPRIRTTPR